MKYLIILLAVVLISCGESEKQKTERLQQDSIHRFDSLIKPRKEIYSAAVSAVKELLKVPSTAKFPTLLVANDTVRISSNDSKAYVVFPYDAQNPMGTYMHDYAEVKLVKRNGKWEANDRFYAVNAAASSYTYKDFDTHSSQELAGIVDNDGKPMPMPAPAPAPAPMPPPRP